MWNKLLKKYNSLSVQLKAAFWFLFCTVMQKGISVITTPIYTRIMDTEQYGQYGVYSSWFNVISIFVTLKLYCGVYSQGIVKFEEKRDRFSSSLQGLTVVMCGMFFALYAATQTFWNHLFKLDFSYMSAMFIQMWTTAVFGFWATNERVEFKYRKLLLVTVITSLMKPAVGISMILLSGEKAALARAWAVSLVELVCYLPLFFVQMKRGGVFFDKKIWKYAICFNLPLLAHYLSQTVLSVSDRIMIERLIDVSSSGIYSLAHGLAMLMLLVSEAMQQTLAPWIYRKIKYKQLGDIHNVVYAALGLVAAANLMLILIAPEAVRIFAPASYYEAIWVIPPIAMTTFFIFLYAVFSFFEFYYEKSMYISVSTIAAALLNIILNYIFIKQFGYYAAGYTTLVCYITYATLHYLVMRMICKKECGNARPFSLKVLIGMSVAFMGCGFAILLLYGTTVLRYGIFALLLAVCALNYKKILGLYRLVKKKDEPEVGNHETADAGGTEETES